MMVSFGSASGPVPPFDLALLMRKGSLFITRPTLVDFTYTLKHLQATANDLFKVVKSGKVKIEINQTYALKDAVKSHEDLAARKTTGSTILLP